MANVVYAGDGGIFKVCTKCGAAKPPAEFHKSKDCLLGVRAHCMVCACEDAKAHHRNNRESVVARQRTKRAEDPDGTREYFREWAAKNPEKRRAYFRKWAAENPENYKRSYTSTHQRVRERPKARLEATIRAGIHRGIRHGSKDGRGTFGLLGYTCDDLMAHLEREFAPGMSWDNFGEWHIDHKSPLSAHNYITPDDIDFSRAWALNNLRPLWAKDNLSKGAKLMAPFQPSLALG